MTAIVAKKDALAILNRVQRFADVDPARAILPSHFKRAFSDEQAPESERCECCGQILPHASYSVAGKAVIDAAFSLARAEESDGMYARHLEQALKEYFE